jgi:pyrroloquinoline quinone biosynthesis protein D
MSTDRGGRRTGRNGQQGGAARPLVRLAPGIRVDGGVAKDDVVVLVGPQGKVQLNRIAAAILRLCDGTRDRDEVVAEVVRSSRRQTRAVEIVEFLDVARARGWIEER